MYKRTNNDANNRLDGGNQITGAILPVKRMWAAHLPLIALEVSRRCAI